MGEVVQAVESDVALVITVLRIANRTAQRKKGKIASIPEAVEILTPEGVETLAARTATFDFFERTPGWDLMPERFRLHAVATQAAADRLFGLLPAEQSAYVRRLWEEFEAQVTPEARYANALDRMQPLLLNASSGGGSWRKWHVESAEQNQRVVLLREHRRPTEVP